MSCFKIADWNSNQLCYCSGSLCRRYESQSVSLTKKKAESKISSLLSVWVIHERCLRGGHKTET